MSPLWVQAVPLYSSAFAKSVGWYPPKTNPAVNIPVVPAVALALFIVPPVVQLVPSYSSVKLYHVSGLADTPPHITPAVKIPKPDKYPLAVPV